MSEKLKAKIGEELYNKILEKGLKPEEFDIIKNNYVPLARFNEVNTNLKATNSKVESYEKQLEKTKTLLENSEEYKTKYDSLLDTHKNELAEKDKEILNTSKRFRVESELAKQGAKHTSLLLREIDLDKISIENDNLLGLEPAIAKLKTDFGDLFVTKGSGSNNTGKPNETPPEGGGSDVDYDAMFKDL